MKKISILLFLIISLLTVTSCNSEKDEIEKLYTVTFEENGGEEVADIQNIKKDSTVVLPEATRKGYIFKGWYTSKKFIDGTNVTNETPIGKNITLYANWSAIKYNLTLNLNGGIIESDYHEGVNKVNYGTVIQLPEATKDGYLFEGWFVANNKIADEVTIEGDTTINSKWIDINTLQKEYSVKLDIDGGLLYKYNEKEELMEDFLKDFSNFTKRNVDTTNFWDMSYRGFLGDEGFLNNEYYFNKWVFFLEYLATTTKEENKYLFEKIINQESLNYDQQNVAVTVVRNEILAFFLNTERIVPGWGEMVSANYAKEELQKGYLNYCQLEIPDKYETGQGLKLGTPLKEGYLFLGWYDNPDFEGSIYTEIGKNEYGNREFYALFGEVK